MDKETSRENKMVDYLIELSNKADREVTKEDALTIAKELKKRPRIGEDGLDANGWVANEINKRPKKKQKVTDPDDEPSTVEEILSQSNERERRRSNELKRRNEFDREPPKKVVVQKVETDEWFMRIGVGNTSREVRIANIDAPFDWKKYFTTKKDMLKARITFFIVPK